MTRQHLDHGSALELFVNVFLNGDGGKELENLASVDYSGGSTATDFRLPTGVRWTFCASDDPHEMQMRIRPRHCILSGKSAVADAASCLRNYADQLTRAAAALEEHERAYLSWREKIPLPDAGLEGKAVAQ